MRWWKQWRRREEAIAEEIRTHLAMAVHDRVEKGESPGDAERGARREFGNELLIKEATREMWGWTTVERFVQDLKYVFRQMRRPSRLVAARQRSRSRRTVLAIKGSLMPRRARP